MLWLGSGSFLLLKRSADGIEYTQAITSGRFFKMSGSPFLKGGDLLKGSVALVREQGQNFAILMVKDSVITDPSMREDMLAFGEQEFGVRTALMGERQHRTYGPDDIVRWLSSVYVEQLPWRDYSIN